MAEQAEKNEITLEEVSKAIQVVGILLSQISIPASRAQEFALLNSVLGELKAFVDGQIAQTAQSDSSEIAVETEAPSA